MNRSLNASRNIVWGMINGIVSLVFPFLTRTVLIDTMGLPYAGLSGFFSSILNLLNLAELGIGSALVFSMYKPIAEQDDAKVCALLNFYRKCYRVIGLVILGLGLLLLPWIQSFVHGEVPSDVNLSWAFGIYLLNQVLEYFVFAYKYSLILAMQRNDYLSKISALIRSLTGISGIAVLLLTRNYYLYALVLPLATIANNLLIARITRKHYPQYQCKGELSKEEKADLKKKISGLLLQKIGGVLNSYIDTLVISAFLGLVSLAMYQNYFTIVTAVMGLIDILISSLTATVGNYMVTEDAAKNHALFKNLNFAYLGILGWCSICMLCLYQPFMELWLGKELLFSNGMMFLFVLYFFTFRWCDMIGLFQTACGLWWESRFIPLISAVLNLVVNLILVQVIGLPGVLLSTIVSMVLVYDTVSCTVLFRTYFRKITGGAAAFWKKQLLYLTEIAVTAGAAWLICSRVSFQKTIFQFLFNALVCIVIPVLMLYVLRKNRPEMAFVNRYLNKFKEKIRRK